MNDFRDKLCLSFLITEMALLIFEIALSIYSLKLGFPIKDCTIVLLTKHSFNLNII